MKVREESEVFSDLAQLCVSPGYVHAIAYLCFRDNAIKYGEQMTVQDILQQYSMDRLVRTETSTLIGLACKNKIDYKLPSQDVIQGYIEKTDALLKEIHYSMMKPQDFDLSGLGDKDFNSFKTGGFLRESIFYDGDSAYYFQYRDLSKIKYQKDNEWFIENKNFTVQQSIDVVVAIHDFQNEKINDVMKGLAKKTSNELSFLQAYIFTVEDIVSKAMVETVVAKSVIESFVAPAAVNMDKFSALDDFNPKNAYPIIRLTENKFLLFQEYRLVEALYETPFFWFNDDLEYKNSAMKHRGEFTEEFSTDRLKLVFGENRVYSNIDIYDSKNNRAGEIDVLVVFANRAIILQAKSKKLTIAARKGNDNSLQEDFKKAIQDAYDQCYSCAELLQDKNNTLIDSEGNELNLDCDFKEIYPFCIVSDHYPALSFQAKQFLQFQTTDIIMTPFVMDVFLLDVMTEMLQSPLHFLSYVNRRTNYGDKIQSHHELTILSYHLKHNLWVDDEVSLMFLEDDICASLDLAMLTRRDGVPGIDLPEGILTKYRDTIFGRIIRDIDSLNDAATVDLGFMLLSLSSDSIERINDGISQLVSLTKRDGNHHDFSLGVNRGNTGLTIHCNTDHIVSSVPRLEKHCTVRQYALKTDSWFGICMGPKDARLRFGVSQNYEWKQSNEMDEIIKDLPKPQYLKGKKKVNLSTITKPEKKIGRNEKCLCGSGKKYKKCCLV
jgi:hypothetical protein